MHEDNDPRIAFEKQTDSFFVKKYKIGIKFSDMLADNIFAHAPHKSFY